jgi:hypothetical protein
VVLLAGIAEVTRVGTETEAELTTADADEGVTSVSLACISDT